MENKKDEDEFGETDKYPSEIMTTYSKLTELSKKANKYLEHVLELEKLIEKEIDKLEE